MIVLVLLMLIGVAVTTSGYTRGSWRRVVVGLLLMLVTAVLWSALGIEDPTQPASSDGPVSHHLLR